MTTHEAMHLFYDDIKICGCGQPDAAVMLVRDILLLCPLYEHREELGALLPSPGIQQVVLGILTDADLLEHGSGIGGSWITDKGQELLAAIEPLTAERLDELFDMESEIPDDCQKCYPPDVRAANLEARKADQP